jgi:hypothetical protein
VCGDFGLSAEPTPAPVCGGFGAFVLRVGSEPCFAAAVLSVLGGGVFDAVGTFVCRLFASSA